jgi:predicted signal transduction protein with EAL and GGDEF domain
MPELSQRAEDTRSEDFRMYLVIRYIAYLGLGVHVVCVPLFLVLGVPALAVFNIFSSVAWFVGYLANRRGNHALAITLLTTEVVAHTIVAVYCVGWHAGFQNLSHGRDFIHDV